MAQETGTDPRRHKSDIFYSIMVHNISHSDLLVSLKGSTKSIIGRPRFNEFQEVSKQIFEKLDWNSTPADKERDGKVKVKPVCYQSSLPGKAFISTSSLQSFLDSGSSTAELLSHASMCPYGWETADKPFVFDSCDRFRLKSSKTDDIKGASPHVLGVYLPVLAVLIRRWIYICKRRHPKNSRKILYLLSGYATPYDDTSQPQQNSTKYVGEMMIDFCRQFYPEVEPILVHSGKEIFHYDTNVLFINHTLRPMIERHRRELAEKFYDKWPEKMHVVLTLTTGSAARMSALQASLRGFKPDSLHMWQLKTFWHEYPQVTERAERDVEFHRFQKVEMTPAIPRWRLDPSVQALVQEMVNLRKQLEDARDGPHYNELDTFWLRKSKRPVLAVLMVQKKHQEKPYFVKGINMEVSLPTGSLCSERNAIGTALSNDPTLVRKDLKMIAVLAVSLNKDDTSPFTAASNHSHIHSPAKRQKISNVPQPLTLSPIPPSLASISGTLNLGQSHGEKNMTSGPDKSPSKADSCCQSGPNTASSPYSSPPRPKRTLSHSHSPIPPIFESGGRLSPSRSRSSPGPNRYTPSKLYLTGM